MGGTESSDYAPSADIYGKITGDYDTGCVQTNGADKSNSTINIYDGAVLSRENGIAVYLPSGTLNVHGGSITGATGIYMKASKLNITGGTITATGMREGVKEDNNGAYSTGCGIVLEYAGPNYHAISSLSISGGKIVSKNADPIYEYVRESNTSPVLKHFITGGTFSAEPDAELIADGYVVTKTGDGMYVVGKPAPAVDPAPAADPVPAQPSAKTGDKQDDKLVEAKNDDEEVPADVKVEGSVVKITVTDKKGTAAKADEVTIKSVAALEELGAAEASIQFNENVVVELDVASIKAEGASSITVKFEDDSVQIICDGVVIFEADLSEFTASGEKLTIKFVDGVLKVFDSNGTLLKEFTNK